MTLAIFLRPSIFQFTPLREGRLGTKSASAACVTISIHAPPRGATPTRTAASGRPEYFNSRPSARGDVVKVPICRAAEISIHAPPRGATRRGCGQGDGCRCISIHAPPRGATSRRPRVRASGKFQFTPLREGRLPWTFLICCLPLISIHAPPRGATASFLVSKWRDSISIHAPPRGATARPGRNICAESFQFTPLREGRPHRISPPPNFSNFNSRPSARGDGKRYAISANLLFNPYKSAWLNNSATQFVEIILVIFHRIIA